MIWEPLSSVRQDRVDRFEEEIRAALRRVRASDDLRARVHVLLTLERALAP